MGQRIQEGGNPKSKISGWNGVSRKVSKGDCTLRERGLFLPDNDVIKFGLIFLQSSNVMHVKVFDIAVRACMCVCVCEGEQVYVVALFAADGQRPAPSIMNHCDWTHNGERLKWSVPIRLQGSHDAIKYNIFQFESLWGHVTRHTRPPLLGNKCFA